MNKGTNISEQLKCLVYEYDFNIDTLSKYLKLNNNEIQELANGNISFLPYDYEYRSTLFNKIAFLYDIAVNEEDFRLKAFLEGLISYHNISKKTISKMSGVDVKEIDKLLSLKNNKISIEDKYKLAITTVSLKFFLKDNEK